MMVPSHAKTFVDLLEARVQDRGEALAYRFLITGDVSGATETLTYRALGTRTRSLAAQLSALKATGERALLLYPPGLDFVTAFLGCLYSGTIAVPAPAPHPARLEKSLPHLAAIAADCGARFVLTTGQILHKAQAVLAKTGALASLEWVVTDSEELPGSDAFVRPALTDESVAFLQYTSGSTGSPKGVIVGHRNILSNHALCMQAFPESEQSVTVSWLPHYHDMGLIGGILYSLYFGGSSVLMPPWAFLQSPRRWLRAISEFGGTISPAPNFAYELCARKLKPEDLQGLSLSSWEHALNGAEPIRLETLELFAERFAPYGFRRSSFLPCYGLAEATLMVSGVRPQNSVTVTSLRKNALEHGRVELTQSDDDGRPFVSSGLVPGGQQVAIVHPETHQRLPELTLGEIWVAGPSVTRGYWNRQAESAEVFGGVLGDSPETQFLRTGDLGFIRDGALYITGRSKDLMIIRGRNCYPQDVELTVERAHPKLRSGGVAAFSIEVDREERLALVVEVDHRRGELPADEIFDAIRRAVIEEHELDAQLIALVKPGDILKTTSGKIRRRACRAALLDGRLAILASFGDAHPNSHSNSTEIEAWLRATLARHLRVTEREIDITAPFARYGLESKDMIGLSGELQDWLRRPVAPTVLYECPSIAELARHLSAEAPAAPRAIESDNSRPLDEPIAIVGMACRFPGDADSPEAFWQLLEEGRDAISETPSDRWDVERYYDPAPGTPGKMYVRRGGFLRKVDEFDASFFAISPREASSMDPQQRLLLEVSWSALEDAAIAPGRLAGSRAGVFVGVSSNDYARYAFGAPEDVDGHAGTGNASSVAAGRISYLLGLNGPSLVVDTACSSSLVATHLACQSLRQRECDVALAGGVNVILSPETTLYFCQVRALSPEGRCSTFDADANGYVRSEGCGMVVLMRLSEAKAAGHPILAVIRGSAINHDGKTNGLTAPSGPAQQQVIRQALANARLAPEQIDYVEAHGTGTALGDPIELSGLAETLVRNLTRRRPLVVGSVKTNLGHLEAAAGVAGLIKTVLALQHRRIPAHLNFSKPSAQFDWSRNPIVVPMASIPWEQANAPRRAGTSSFGFSGTNAHLILEEAPANQQSLFEAAPANLLVLSARTETALKQQAARMAQRLETAPVEELCFTAAVGRSHFEHRLAVVGSDRAELISGLATHVVGDPDSRAIKGHVDGPTPRVVFVFPGQGGQWSGMGRQLLESSNAFRSAIEQCDTAIHREAGWSLLELLRSDATECLQEIDVVQPALFSLSVALAALWRSWGVEPNTIVGQSMGEVAAAHVAGALSLEDAVRIICRRSRLLCRIRGQGEMALVELGIDEAAAELKGLEDQLSIAVSSTSRSTVLSGQPGALAAVLDRLESRGIYCRRIKVDVASHSPQVEPLKRDLLAMLEVLRPSRTSLPMRSTVTGQLVDGSELGPSYWWNNLREPVRFAPVIDGLLSEERTVFVEMSPHPTVLHSIQELLNDRGSREVALGSLRRDTGDVRSMLENLGSLFVQGYPVDWERALPRRELMSLPTYPFERVRHWTNARRRTRAVSRENGSHPWLPDGLPLLAPERTRLWSFTLGVETCPWLDGHQVQGMPLLPGSAYIEMLLSAGREVMRSDELRIETVEFQQPLVLPTNGDRTLQMLATEEQPGRLKIQIASRTSPDAWRIHATGVVVRGNAELSGRTHLDLEAIAGRLGPETAPDALYEALALRGLELGPGFRCIGTVHAGNGEALGRARLPSSVPRSSFFVHPALLDACIQLVGAAGLIGAQEESPAAWMLTGIEALTLHRPLAGTVLCHATLLDEMTPGRRRAQWIIADENGMVAITAELVFRRVAFTARSAAEMEGSLVLDWERADVSPSKGETRRWVLIGDGNGLAQKLGRRLMTQGQEVVLASSFDADLFAGPAPTGVVLLHGLDLSAFDTAHSERGCDVALHVVQALASAGWRDMPRLYLFTRGAQTFGHEAGLALEQAPLLGMARVIAQEHPEFRCTRVDLPPEQSESAVDALLRELLADDAEDEICLRAEGRFVARLDRQPIAPSLDLSDDTPVVRSDGTYLITGGLGGLGLAAARWLAQQSAGKVVLVGRNGPRSDEQERALDELCQSSTQVRVAIVDVADRERLAELINELEASGPPLRGIIHAAAALEDGLLINQTVSRFRSVLAAKAAGAFHLHELTHGLALDFFVLYSSATAMLGSPGLANYVAANVFLDALAHHRRRLDLPALSINWGVFSGVGLGATQVDRRAMRMAEHGIRSITPEEGLEILGRLLRGAPPQVGVVPMDVRLWTETLPNGSGSRLASRLMSRPRDRAESAGDTALLRSLSDIDRPERLRRLEDFAQQQVAHVLRLKMEQVPHERPLGELGMDSVMGLELRNRFVAALGLVIPVTVLWTYPTIHALAGYLADALGSPAPAEEAAETFACLDDEEKTRLLAEGIAAFERLLEDETDRRLVVA